MRRRVTRFCSRSGRGCRGGRGRSRSRRGRRGRHRGGLLHLEVRPAEDRLPEHAEEVSLPEEEIAGDAPEAVDVEEAVPGLHD